MHTGVEVVNPWADGFHQRLRCLVVKPNEFFRHRLKSWRVEKICRQRLQNQNPAEFSRHCLENLINSLSKRFARRRLANSTDDAMTAEYKTALPDEAILAAEIDHTREALSRRGLLLGEKS